VPERARTPEAELARLGLGAQAVPALRTMGVWGDEGATGDVLPVLRVLGSCADPDRALVVLAALAQDHPGAWAGLLASDVAMARTVVVAGASATLGDLLAGRPELLVELTGDLEPWDAVAVAARATDALSEAAGQGGGGGRQQAAAAALVRVQRQGLLRVAARDLTGLADTPTTARELAALAEGILAAALDHVAADVPDARVAVIGMGKLGGRELNFVSDVDVIFVHDGDWAGAIRVAERFLRLLGETTPDGRVYEIDPNLRPEGRDGPLSRSLDAFAGYYARWARTWEFQALLKARPVAGDEQLGAGFMALVEPYVWPDRLEAEAVAEIQRMKGVVESSKDVRRDGARQLKLAPGGLRDIEFAVQLLQLVHGRHDPSLRSGNTLEALRALSEGGYVDEGDAYLFSDAYQFLRTVEHRLQLANLRRTHTVPVDEQRRYRLARAAGFRDLAGASALVQFDKEYRRIQGAVRRLHEKLFYRPLLDRFAELGADAVLAGEGGGLAEEGARDRLVALGFDDPARALGHLEALASGVSRRARLFQTLLPAVLPTLAATPDPDGGLAAFRSLAERLEQSPTFLRTLRDNPPVGELLVKVLGHSRLVGEWLERQPDVFSQLADLPGLARSLSAEDYRKLADGLVRRSPDPDTASSGLRRLRRREAARVAVRNLGGYADIHDVGRELTGIAEATLEAAVALAVPGDLRVAVIGMGKLGAGELAYSSDLDVLLVFEPADSRDEANRAAEQLLRLLGEVTPEGQAFRVDVNLRPEGKDGPLVRTLDSYLAYYERWGEPWELQALTQARAVAGDAQLGESFVRGVAPLVYPERSPAERLQAVRRMKARVERERAVSGKRRPAARAKVARAPGGTGGTFPRAARGGAVGAGGAARLGDRLDLKLGAGGLSDVEWTVQLLQLRLGGRLPRLQTPGTIAALGVLEAEGVVDGRDAAWLREGWELLSRIRNALYLMGARDPSVLPPGPAQQERVARMLGHPAPGTQALLEELGRRMRRVRKVHERLFYDA
jgi:[glutamine synthetase] adenylyltransferase / [glutamine synthetase]-adenylyl-L-tyrosine phosphorylase